MNVGTDIGNRKFRNDFQARKIARILSKINVVPEVGLEPTSLAAADFEFGRLLIRSKGWLKKFPRTYGKHPVNMGTAPALKGPTP